MTQLTRTQLGLVLFLVGVAFSLFEGEDALGQELKPKAVLDPKPEFWISTVYSMAFTEDGKTLMTAELGKVFLWDVATGKWRRLGTSCPAAITPDGKRLVCAGGKGIQLWDAVAAKELIPTIEEKKRMLMAVAITNDGKMLAWAGDDGNNLRLWDVEAGKEVLNQKTSGICSLAFSADGKTLAAGTSMVDVKLWDVTARKELETLKAYKGTGYGAAFSAPLAFTSDGKTLVSGNEDGIVRLWDVDKRKQLDPLPKCPSRSLVLTADGKYLVGGGHESKNSDPLIDPTGIVKVWDLATHKELATLTLPNAVSSVAVTPDGKTLAVASLGTNITLWDVAQVLAQKPAK
jgi:WD40 repeat protein